MTHEHPGGPDPIEHREPAPGESELLALAVMELLIEKGVLSADEVRRTIEATDRRTPELGRRLVARAWVDPAFKERLLADGRAAAEALGIDMLTTRLVVLENTPEVHNLVVAPCVPVTRARSWACRRTGTRAGPTAPARSGSRAPSWPSSAP